MNVFSFITFLFLLTSLLSLLLICSNSTSLYVHSISLLSYPSLPPPPPPPSSSSVSFMSSFICSSFPLYSSSPLSLSRLSSSFLSKFSFTRKRKSQASQPPKMEFPIHKKDEEWRQILTPYEYEIIREKGTELAGSGEYSAFFPSAGYFKCRACGHPLYSAKAKFDAKCGWPAFDKMYEGAIRVQTDHSLGRIRQEIMCSQCGGHLGHVFTGEQMTSTNERHCVNSISVRYVKESLPPEKSEEVTYGKSSSES